MNPYFTAPGKYVPLVQYLVALPTDQHVVTLTLAEIAALIGPLAATASTATGYWTASHVARVNWHRAGFIARLDRQAQTITFTRS